MLNRRIFMALAGVLPGIGAAHAATEKKHKVAYHLSEPGKANFVLRNIHNHIKGVGGPDKLDLVLVTHGPALKVFNTMSGDQSIIARLKKLQDTGVKFRACGNTMHALKFTLADLPANTVKVSQGGVVHLMELQEQGYSYIRP